MLVLGIMSGTSIDGVDYALCKVTRRSVRLEKLWSRDFPARLRTRLHAAAADACSAHGLAQLHHDLGRLYAKQAAQLNARAELVGLHGQTVFHNPNARAPATMQIGEPAYLAEALRIPVVANFRVADLAAGGQGAPLATLFHQVVFAQRGKHVCVNNLGGISNVTSLDWSDRSLSAPRVMSFDTGPANVLLDLAMRELTAGRKKFDSGGALAKCGTISEPLLERWLRHPYFRKSPPKSTGRELFGERFWSTEKKSLQTARLSSADLMATLTEFTARSLARSYAEHLPSLPAAVILCGGGARNPVLRDRIAARLRMLAAGVQVGTSDELGWPSEAIEPAAFALLAAFRWRGLPTNIPTTTGARRPVLLGHIVFCGA